MTADDTNDVLRRRGEASESLSSALARTDLVMVRRLAARLLDIGIVAAFLAVPRAMVDPSGLDFGGGTEIVFVWVLLLFVGWPLCEGLLLAAWAATPGKWLFGLRVVAAGVCQPSTSQALVRSILLCWSLSLLALVGAVSWFRPSAFGAAVVVLIGAAALVPIVRGRPNWLDKAAATTVIRYHRRGNPPRRSAAAERSSLRTDPPTFPSVDPDQNNAVPDRLAPPASPSRRTLLRIAVFGASLGLPVLVAMYVGPLTPAEDQLAVIFGCIGLSTTAFAWGPNRGRWAAVGVQAVLAALLLYSLQPHQTPPITTDNQAITLLDNLQQTLHAAGARAPTAALLATCRYCSLSPNQRSLAQTGTISFVKEEIDTYARARHLKVGWGDGSNNNNNDSADGDVGRGDQDVHITLEAGTSNEYAVPAGTILMLLTPLTI